MDDFSILTTTERTKNHRNTIVTKIKLLNTWDIQHSISIYAYTAKNILELFHSREEYSQSQSTFFSVVW